MEDMDEPLKKKFKIEGNDIEHELEVLQKHLLKNCLCSLSENVIQKLFRRFHSTDIPWPHFTSTWSTDQILILITCVQLICEKTAKQSASGFICSRIADVHNTLTRKENTLIDYFIDLVDDSDQFVSFAASRALMSFFLVVKSRFDPKWINKLIGNLKHSSQPYKMSFSLDVLKRVIEGKDFDEYAMEDDLENYTPTLTCHTLSIRSEYFDSTLVKCHCIKSLESEWWDIVNRFIRLIKTSSVTYESPIIIFLSLWETIISVKANLSIIDTKPFYSHLEKYVLLLSDDRSPSSPIIWKHILSLFNEVLCYGSTLALQHDLADEPRLLANQIVRSVKDKRLLRMVPCTNRNAGFGGGNVRVDRVLLKKLVLLILKAVAVFVKQAKCHSSSDSSSDSSIGSDLEDEDPMMIIIERIHDGVLQQLNEFIKPKENIFPDHRLATWIVQLFSDQDDYLVESMICCLDVARVLCYRSNYLPNLREELNPSRTFLQFLHTISFDLEVLLEFLVSNETFFLLYILNFLKYVRDQWNEFSDSCGCEIKRVMEVLDNLRESLERLVSKDLFPYNINPVLSLLIECREKYRDFARTSIS